jgi:hypothetical protein
VSALDIRPTRSYGELAAIAQTRLDIDRGLAGAGTLPDGSSDSSLRGADGERPEWYGTPSMDVALDMLRHGWDAGTDRLKALTDSFAYAADQVPGWVNDVAGSRPCVPSYVSGAPDCMLQRIDVDTTRPRVRLVVQINYHCGIKPDAVARYAAAVAIAVERLVADGHDVEVLTVDRTHGCRGYLTPFVVMPFGTPLDLSRLAFAVHPSFFRRIVFAVREMDGELDTEVRSRSGGYGMPTECTAHDVRAAFPHTADDVVTVVLPWVQEIANTLRSDTDIAACVERFASVIRPALESAT